MDVIWTPGGGEMRSGRRVGYVFGIGVEGVPHGGDDLGHFAEGRVGILTLDGRLSVPEEQGVRRHRSIKQNTIKFNSTTINIAIIVIGIGNNIDNNIGNNNNNTRRRWGEGGGEGRSLEPAATFPSNESTQLT